jgi:predicted RNase H-like HicB family nuclease
MDAPDAKSAHERDRLVALLGHARRAVAMRYVGVVRRGPGGDFSVDFPDLPGCITAGKTMPEVRRLAAEALAFHLDGMATGGLSVPVARSLGAIRDDPHCLGAITLILVEASTKPT